MMQEMTPGTIQGMIQEMTPGMLLGTTLEMIQETTPETTLEMILEMIQGTTPETILEMIPGTAKAMTIVHWVEVELLWMVRENPLAMRTQKRIITMTSTDSRHYPIAQKTGTDKGHQPVLGSTNPTTGGGGCQADEVQCGTA